MNAFLAELGKQLVTRWAAALVLPGALFAAAMVLAHVLGQGHAVDLAALPAWLDGVTGTPDGARGAALLVDVAAFLLGAAAAALAAQSVGMFVAWTWSLTASAPLLRQLADRRRRRWERADAEAAEAERAFLADTADPARRAGARRATARRAAICLVEPARPTWTGDRLHAADVRVWRSYGIDLAPVWPRLWLVLPEEARGELTAVQDRCATAARLVGWGVLYAILGAFWWPALVVGVAILLAARHRCRQSVAVYAELVEAAVDLYGRELAVQLGFPCPGRLTGEVGERISGLVRKDGTVPRARRPESTPQPRA